MECTECKEHLTQYSTEGAIDDDLLDQIEEHIAICDNCYNFFQIQMNLLDKLKTPEAKELVDASPDYLISLSTTYQEQGNFEKAVKCLNEALELRPGDKEIEAKIAEIGLVKENIEVYINNIPFHKFTVSNNKLFVELYRGGNAKPVRVSVKYPDGDDYFFVDLSHNDITYYKLTGTTYETKEGKGKILEISSKTKEKASQEVVLIDDEYRGRIRYKVVLSEDADSATLVIDLA